MTEPNRDAQYFEPPEPAAPPVVGVVLLIAAAVAVLGTLIALLT